jgi:hypothetical protein
MGNRETRVKRTVALFEEMDHLLLVIGGWGDVLRKLIWEIRKVEGSRK